MRPVDPRLLSRIGSARRLVILLGGLQAASAFLVLLQALILARLLGHAFAPAAAGVDGLGPIGALIPVSAREPGVGLPLLGAVIAGRAAIAWAVERIAHRAGARAVAALRAQIVSHSGLLGPRWLASGEAPAVSLLATRGLDNLLPYFTRYLPTLVTAATVTPIAVAVILGLDLVSAMIVVFTLPLIPIFMWLVGRLTETHARHHLAAITRLGSQTLDLIAGLPTLRALGRSRGPVGRIRELGEAHRRAAMASLRVAFLSGAVLEFLTTISVALIAVTMGFRLAGGSVPLEMALAVLVLAPEAYLPLRNIGLHFHASTDGIAAANAAFAFLERPAPADRGTGAAPALRGATIHLDRVSVDTPDGLLRAPAGLTLTARPGRITALVGPNGEGKSTALAVLAGLLFPDDGRVTARGPGGSTLLAAADGGGVRPEGWTSQCAWVPQRPELGEMGWTLSLGQRERIAVDRALASGRPLILLDEPTGHLDGKARLDVVRDIRRAADAGAVVVVSTHDPAVISAADDVVEVRAVEVAARGGRVRTPRGRQS